jgi:hypothetical protein
VKATRPRCGLPVRRKFPHAGGPCVRPAGHPGRHRSAGAHARKQQTRRIGSQNR